MIWKKNKFNSHVHFKLSVTLLVLFVLFERTRWMRWKRYTLDWSHLIRTMNNRGRFHYTYCFFIDLIIRYKNAYVFHIISMLLKYWEKSQEVLFCSIIWSASTIQLLSFSISSGDIGICLLLHKCIR